jgi:transcriptional regulator with XRE-family HTH domain
MSDFGTHIRQLRQQMGLTQSALAQGLNLSGNSLISRIESGRVKPTPRVIELLAQFFDRDLEALNALKHVSHDQSGLHGEITAMTMEANRSRDQLAASVDSLLHEFKAHQESLSDFLVASKLNLVWSLSRKLRHERQAKRVWVISPDLESETARPEIKQTVKNNVRGGTEYRYLVPERVDTIQRGRALLDAVGPDRIEIRIAPEAQFAFAIETVLYDPETPRRVGLMVAPTRRPEFDIVLGSQAADSFERAFKDLWASSTTLTPE